MLGAGHTGVEAAAAWADGRREVLLVESSVRILPDWDAPLADAAHAALLAAGVGILVGWRAVAVEASGTMSRVTLRAGGGAPDRCETADLVVAALGWRPELAGLGVERTRALGDRDGFLQVDSRFETAEPGLHALGGALALPLTPQAVREQVASVVDVVAGREPVPVRFGALPRVIERPVPLLTAGLSAAGARSARIPRGHRSRSRRRGVGALRARCRHRQRARRAGGRAGRRRPGRCGRRPAVDAARTAVRRPGGRVAAPAGGGLGARHRRRGPAMNDAQTDLLRALADRLGPGGLLTGSAALSVYSRDASHLSGGRPLAVALPAREEDIAHVVAAVRRRRRAGGGARGRHRTERRRGAVAPARSSWARRDWSRSARSMPWSAPCAPSPGVLNATLSRHAAPHGLHFAPDPSSQAASTIGGNIAENAGGPHCLRLGVTSHHLRALDWCDARGRAWTTGEPVAVSRGIDLRGLLCGSEGTLGLVTGAWLQLTPTPPAVATLLARFPRARARHGGGAAPAAGRAAAGGRRDHRPGRWCSRWRRLSVSDCRRDVEAVMIAELAGDAAAVGPQADLAGRDAAARPARARCAAPPTMNSAWRCGSAASARSAPSADSRRTT